MKTNGLLLPFLALGLLIIVNACDKVEVPIPEPDIIIPEGNDSVVITFPTIDSANINRSFKKTYVEEFTGHQCITCPFNTKLLLAQAEDNKERMVITAIHAGQFANVNPPDYPTDFNTPYGTELFQHYSISQHPIPSSIINRRRFASFDNALIFNGATQFWDEPIDEYNANMETDFAMGVAADYRDSLDLFYIRVSVEVLNQVTGNYRLLVLCLEDSVIAPQLDGQADESVYPKKIVTDYAHRHVLRSKLSQDQSLSGDLLINGSAEANEWFDYTLNARMPENVVNPEKTSIVVVLADPETEEVLQAEEVHVNIL
jgi:hypothetical protein